jgi:hypothetical protein
MASPRLFYRAALICGLAPLATGIGIFLLWLIVGWDWLMAAGVLAIFGGAISTIVGAGCLVAYAIKAARTDCDSHVGVRVTIALTALIINFPVALAIAFAAMFLFLRIQLTVSGPLTTGSRLVHMTEAGEAIRSSGRLGLPGDLYAGPASNAELSGWALTSRTGLSPGGTFEPIFIPEAAEAAFSRPIPVGIATGWQRFTGQQYAARGFIDLSTGEFTRTGINRTQALWYTVDVIVDGVAVGVVYWYATGGEEP